MKYHNPENLTEWGQADGWRLLTTEEIKQPLPDDAECRRITNGQWRSSTRIGAFGADHITYRTREPLPVSQLIAQLDAEIKAKQELKDIALAVEAGAEWEFLNGDWISGKGRTLANYIGNLEVRLKPKPVTRPWNRPQDIPFNCRMRRKGVDEWFVPTHAYSPGIFINAAVIGWKRMSDYEHTTPELNGEWEPCEVTEEAK